jgi:hypothetical protein
MRGQQKLETKFRKDSLQIAVGSFQMTDGI